MAVVIWAPEDCLPIWAAQRLAEIRKQERREAWLRFGIEFALGLVIGAVIVWRWL